MVDHEHVPGWKRMPPKQRALYVRGILCSTCNHFIVSRYATVGKMEAAALYLKTYEARKP